MTHNGKVFGILSTMRGWCFCRRANGGQLWITRMYGDYVAIANLCNNAATDGYRPTLSETAVPFAQRFSVMKAIYFMSWIAQTTGDLPETPANGLAGQVTLPRTANPLGPAARIQQPPPPPQPPQLPGNANYGYQPNYYGNYHYQIL